MDWFYMFATLIPLIVGMFSFGHPYLCLGSLLVAALFGFLGMQHAFRTSDDEFDDEWCYEVSCL